MTSSAPLYYGNGFALALPSGWSDATLHVLQGPTAAGHQHVITVQTLPNADADTLDGFAQPLVEAAERSLRQAELMILDTIPLSLPPKERSLPRKEPPRVLQAQPSGGRSANGRLPARQGHPEEPRARRAVLRWRPEGADQPHYHEQLFVLAGGTGYVLSASFTQQSRRALGARVERILRSFRSTS